MVTHDDMKREIWRKMLHMGVIAMLPIAMLSKGALVLVIFSLAVFYLAHESYVQGGGSIPLLTAAIQKAKRLGEQEIAHAPFLMGAGVLVTVLIFPLRPAAAGLLQLAFADMAAALVGMTWGEHRLPHSPKKSVEGMCAYFIMAFALMLILFSPGVSLVLAVAGAIIESLPYKDWDNFLIPAGVAALASFF